MTNTDITAVNKMAEKATDELLRAYRLARKGDALTFIKMCQEAAKFPGYSRYQAQEFAKKRFSVEYADYERRQNLGERLPPIFPREGESYEKRRARALARGGIVG